MCWTGAQEFKKEFEAAMAVNEKLLAEDESAAAEAAGEAEAEGEADKEPAADETKELAEAVKNVGAGLALLAFVRQPRCVFG